MREVTATQAIAVKAVDVAQGEHVMLLKGDEIVTLTTPKAGSTQHYPVDLTVLVGSKAELEAEAAKRNARDGELLKYRARIGRDKWGVKPQVSPGPGGGPGARTPQE